MPSLSTQTASRIPVTVVYPAEAPLISNLRIRFRVTKKNFLPVCNSATLPLMVEFRTASAVVILLLCDLLDSSYWERIRKVYDSFDRLEIDTSVRLNRRETKRVVLWLREQSQTLGISVESAATATQAQLFLSAD